jgi:arylsulfatase
MAATGIRFTNFSVSKAVCSASRAAILTGCYSNRVGIDGALFPNSVTGLNPSEEIIPEILKKKGYKSAIFGKWHLGFQNEFLPLQQGFDEFLGLPYSNDMWHYNINLKNMNPKYPPLPLIEGNKMIKEIKTMDDQAQLTTLYTEYAVNFIKKNRNNPFFLYLPHSMPHVPLAVSDKFRGMSKQGTYGDVMMEIDWSVGQILQTLENFGIAENTLVIFTSDNGPWLNYGNHAGSAAGLREGKGTTCEGGHRVPCIMKWPGKIPEGTICNNIASTIDILPTLAAIAHTALPEKKIDGVDIISPMSGDENANPRETFFYYNQSNCLEAVRKNQWKLVFPHQSITYEGSPPGIDGLYGHVKNVNVGLSLYDLRCDPGERYNQAIYHPEIVDELNHLADQMRQELGDSLLMIKGKNVREPGRMKSAFKY